MLQVYSNSFITFAADASIDGTGGLFRSRNPSLVTPVVVMPSWKHAAQTELVVVPEKFWSANVSEAPLNHRAWVLQERILSPRVLHFGETQVFWECKTHDCCETFPKGLPKLTEDLRTRFKGINLETDGALLSRTNVKEDGSRKISSGESTSQPVDETLNGYYVWSRLLEKYSRSKVTKERDGLIAVSGLAQEMQVKLNDIYIVGLWESILPSQLLWRAEAFTPDIIFDIDALDTRKRDGEALSKQACSGESLPSHRRAPIRSWAAIEAPIATSNPSRSGSLITCVPISVGDVLSTVEPALLAVMGDMHVAHLNFEAEANQWTLLINMRAFRIKP